MKETISKAEQKRKDLAEKSKGLLKEEWLHGYLWNLSLVTDPSVTVSIVNSHRPYKVKWQTSGDRKINGKYKAVGYERSRSFKKLDSLLKFLETF